MSKRQPCIECRVLPKWGTRHRCRECYLRHAPIGERIEEAHRRAAMVPVDLRRPRVPKSQWPEGRRWCASCQSFIPLEDARGSMCVPCASERSHGASIEKTYGITATDYASLSKLQDGRCAICRRRPKKKRLAVDHDHKTGAVRGLLCSKCNHELLGAGYDSPAMLLAAWHYLNTPPTTGSWIRPEDGLATPSTDAVAPATSESTDDDLDDPSPHGRKVPDKGEKRTSLPLPGGVTRATCDHPGHYVFVGGTRDERGAVRIYVEDASDVIPF